MYKIVKKEALNPTVTKMCIRDRPDSPPERIRIFIGPEGGFQREEVGMLTENGAKAATLGPRILRTETAPMAALSVLMFALGEI